jgi:PDZ domain-containing secreted protein
VHAPGTQTLTLPAHTELNKLYLGGVWDFQQQYAESNGTENTITFTYNAAHVYLVASAKGATAITVMRDGVAVGTFHSDDIDAQGNGTISQARLYKLIDETTPGQHTIKIIIHGKGLDAFTFTFG